MPRIDAHQILTDQIIAAIEGQTGGERWVMPWHRAEGGLPVNASTGNYYSGGNILALWLAASNKGYTSAKWASYKQWAALGRQVRALDSYSDPIEGKGTHIVYYGTADKKDGSEGKFRFARVSSIFNECQLDDYTAPESAEVVDDTVKHANADSFILTTGAVINHGGARACFSPANDTISVPERAAFTATAGATATENYYSTLFHELTHWTGIESRCDRTFGSRFGDQAYAVEELVAEMGAAFLCAELGISSEPREDHALYLAHWLRILKSDPKALHTAASKASQAVKFLQKS